MITRNTTQAIVAVLGMIGLVSATIISLFVPELQEERNLLLGGLIAATSASASWLFRLNGTK